MAARHVLVTALVLTAGCASVAPVGGESGGTPTLTADVHAGMTAELEAYFHTDTPVRITVTELGARGRGVVLNETYSDRTPVTFGDGGGVFRENGDYRVVIRVNGTVRWNEAVAHSERYEVRVESNGTVTVVSHVLS